MAGPVALSLVAKVGDHQDLFVRHAGNDGFHILDGAVAEAGIDPGPEPDRPLLRQLPEAFALAGGQHKAPALRLAG